MPSDLETVVETCLVENEFTSSKDDVALVDYIGKPEGVDKLKDVPREKLAAVLACMYHKQYKNTTLYDMLKYLTEMDDKVTKDQYQQMKETLTTCVQQSQGNDVELLKCVKAVDPPFDYLIATLRDLGEEPLNFCYERCGLKIPDLKRIYAIGDPKQADKLKDVSKEKMVNVVACLYDKLYPHQKLYPSLRQLIDRDDTVTSDQIEQMENTASACYRKVDGKINNVKFLNCVNITEAPFDHLFATIRDVQQALQWCYVRCRILISEMYTLQRNRYNPLKDYIQYIPTDKLGCFMACKAEESTMKNPDQTLQKRLTDLINLKKNIDESKRKEMLQTLNKCLTQVPADEDERYYEVIKCINLFQPPFVDILYNNFYSAYNIEKKELNI
ncbi:uncharacterized protein LOC100678271 isoform X2 [Nasonia vitripennis]|nr:uncharacterized protein LOC100678271 isoform X2 [Nasonia vitripennis]